MRSWNDVQEMIAYTAVRVFGDMFQLDSRWMDFDEISYGHYAIGGYPNFVLFNWPQSVNTEGVLNLWNRLR